MLRWFIVYTCAFMYFRVFVLTLENLYMKATSKTVRFANTRAAAILFYSAFGLFTVVACYVGL